MGIFRLQLCVCVCVWEVEEAEAIDFEECIVEAGNIKKNTSNNSSFSLIKKG